MIFGRRQRRQNSIQDSMKYIDMTPFQQALAKNLLTAIRKARAGGIEEYTAEQLAQVTTPPSQFMAGAPKGTNAQWAYVEMIRDMMNALIADDKAKQRNKRAARKATKQSILESLLS